MKRTNGCWRMSVRHFPNAMQSMSGLSRTCVLASQPPSLSPTFVRSLANPNFPEKLIDKLVHEVPLGIITDISQVGGYPEYSGEPYEDSDGDGMPKRLGEALRIESRRRC